MAKRIPSSSSKAGASSAIKTANKQQNKKRKPSSNPSAKSSSASKKLRTNGGSDKAAGQAENPAVKKPKKTKLKDQKFIPVPASSYLKGKARATNDDDDEGDQDDNGDDDDEILDEDDDMDDEEVGLDYILKGNANSFLSAVDPKALSRSKKETDRIHELEKDKARQTAAERQKERKKNRGVLTKEEIAEIERKVAEEGLEDDWDSDIDGDLSDEMDNMSAGGSNLPSDEDEEEEAASNGGSGSSSIASGSDVELEKDGEWDDDADLHAGYSDIDEDDFASSDDEEDSQPLPKSQAASKKSKAGDEDDLESRYENRRAKFAANARDPAAGEDIEVAHLPVKLASGEIRVMPGKVKIPQQLSKAELKAKQEAALKEDSETDYTDSEADEETDEEDRIEKMAQAKGRYGRMGIVDILTMEFPEGVKSKVKSQQRLAIAKEQIAKLGAEIMSGVELIDLLPLLTRLSTFAVTKVKTPDEEQATADVPSSIRGLAFLSQLAVYKDLIPGYRIRELTELEQAEKVRDEVRRLRDGEKGLVNSYKMYLKTMEAEIKKRTPLASVAIRCMSELLTAAPHFNFAENIMGIVVGRLSKRSWDSDSDVCLQAIITVFRQDVTGKHSFTLLRLVARMIKERNYKIHPNVMACLLHLRLRSELSVRDETPSGKKGKGKWRGRGDKKEAPKVKSEIRKVWMNKNRRKAEKEKKELEKELEDAEAEVNVEERQTVQTETLKNLFVLYFSILKQPKRSPLLASAMEGVAKFAHLVNIEFFRDLLAVLRGIIRGEQGVVDEEDEKNARIVDGTNEARLRMLAIVTAFELLSGQGEALNIDLNDFIVQLYILLPRLAFDSRIEEAEKTKSTPASRAAAGKAGQAVVKMKDIQYAATSDLLFRCLHLIFFSRHASTANSPPWRAAAFAKRLLESALHLPSSTAVRAIEFVGQLVAKEPKLEMMLSNEDRTSDGVYRPDLDDPQLSNSFATNFWELGLLEADHMDGSVREAAHKVANLITV